MTFQAGNGRNPAALKSTGSLCSVLQGGFIAAAPIYIPSLQSAIAMTIQAVCIGLAIMILAKRRPFHGLALAVGLAFLMNVLTALGAKGESPVPGDDVLRVDLTLVEGAAAKGAVCLDGSLPAYHLDRGFGAGANNWLLQFEGGGWCNDTKSCTERKTTHRGSSLYMDKQDVFSGILSDKPWQNPDFYNWNRVKLRYCDGASFGGDVQNQESGLYFRGQRIWHAMIDDLLEKGMNKVEQALLSGCSAGGLAIFFHCDNFRESLPRSANVKCLSDAGFFLDAKDISGAYHIRSFFKSVVTLQDVVKSLPKSCTTSQLDPTECFFPQYLLPNIQTPMFILNAAYDTWQFHNILVPGSADPHAHWHYCKLNPANCTSSQLEILQGYRNEMLDTLKSFMGSETGGTFINSCFAHCQSEKQDTWFAVDSPRFDNKTIAGAVGDWYFNRKVVKEIDYPYPYDKTCHNLLPAPE